MKDFTMYRGNIGTRKRVCKRIAAFVLAFFISFSVVAGSEIQAEASGAEISLGLAALQIIASTSFAQFLNGNENFEIAKGVDVVDLVIAVTSMFLHESGMEIFISEKAIQEGVAPTDYICQRIREYVALGQLTSQEMFKNLLTGLSVAKNGIFSFTADCVEYWKQLLGFVMSDDVYESIEDIPDGSIYKFNGKTAYELSNDKLENLVIHGYQSGEERFFRIRKDNRIENDLYYSVVYYPNQILFCVFTLDLNQYGNSAATMIRYSAYDLSSYTYTVSRNLCMFSECEGKIPYVLFEMIGKDQVVEDNFYINDFIKQQELFDWLVSLNDNPTVENECVNTALVGKEEAADTFVSLEDELDDTKVLTLNPGVIDNVEIGEDDEVIPLPIDNYADILNAILDGIHAIDIPNIGTVTLPDVIDAPTIGVQEKDETYTPVIPGEQTEVDDPAIDEPIDVVDVPGITDVMTPVIDWGLGYISPTKGILSKFPFSIPYDLYLLVAALSGDAAADPISTDPKNLSIDNDLAPPSAKYVRGSDSALKWDLTFTIPWGNNSTTIPLDIDLSDFAWIFRIIRYFTGILWLVGLLSWTRKESN